VSSLRPRLGHWLLRCPLCKSGFTAAAGAFVCQNRHSFDLAREGYANLRVAGDAGRHRAATVQRNFGTVRNSSARATSTPWGRPWPSTSNVLDAGSGTGHHLARLTATMTGPVIGLGLDISKHAVRYAARHWPTLAFAVADLWGEWPVHDAAADLVVSIFAPKNFPEMARVLRHGGRLALAYPGPEHMIELRDRFGLLRQDERSAGRYADMARRLVGPTCVTRLRRRTVLDPATACALILMGPNARRFDSPVLDLGPDPLAVTLEINVLFARKAQRKS